MAILHRLGWIAAHGRGVRLMGAAALLAAIWLLYAGNAGAPLVFDDLGFFGSTDASDYLRSFQPAVPRYWPYASFAVQSLILDQGVAGMRIGNFLLHGLCVLALQALLARLLAALDESGTAVGDSALAAAPTARHEWLALAGAGLFALHPVAVYAVAYLVERTMLMATLFALLMWLSFFRALQGGGWRWLGLSILLYYFAVFSKQHAVLAPAVSLGLVWLFWHGRPQQPRLASLALAFLAYGAIAVAVTFLTTNDLATTYEPMLGYFSQDPSWHQRWYGLERIHWLSVLTQCGLFFKYLGLWLWPNPAEMSIDMREPLLSDPAVWTNWLGLLAYLAAGVLALVLLWAGRHPDRRRLGLLGLGLLALWSGFIVELATVRLQEIFVLYRSYLWMTGLAIGAAVALDALAARWRPRVAVFAGLCIVPFLVFGAHQRLLTFTSNSLLWRDAVRLIELRGLQPSPEYVLMGTERAYKNRGTASALSSKHFADALDDYAKAIELNPQYAPAYQARGGVLALLGRHDEALASLNAALAINPAFGLARLQRAVVFEQIGRKAEALADFRQACDDGERQACAAYGQRQQGG